MQKIWSLGIDWDNVIQEDLILLWNNWCGEIPQLPKTTPLEQLPLFPDITFFEIPDVKMLSL